MAWRCQKHEDLARALFMAHHGTDTDFELKKFPCPKASEWCFWTPDGEQLLIDADAPLPTAEEIAADEEPKHALVKYCPPDGDKWRLLKPNVRTSVSYVYKA